MNLGDQYCILFVRLRSPHAGSCSWIRVPLKQSESLMQLSSRPLRMVSACFGVCVCVWVFKSLQLADTSLGQQVLYSIFFSSEWIISLFLKVTDEKKSESGSESPIIVQFLELSDYSSYHINKTMWHDQRAFLWLGWTRLTHLHQQLSTLTTSYICECVLKEHQSELVTTWRVLE